MQLLSMSLAWSHSQAVPIRLIQLMSATASQLLQLSMSPMPCRCMQAAELPPYCTALPVPTMSLITCSLHMTSNNMLGEMLLKEQNSVHESGNESPVFKVAGEAGPVQISILSYCGQSSCLLTVSGSARSALLMQAEQMELSTAHLLLQGHASAPLGGDDSPPAQGASIESPTRPLHSGRLKRSRIGHSESAAGVHTPGRPAMRGSYMPTPGDIASSYMFVHVDTVLSPDRSCGGMPSNAAMWG